MKKLLIVLTLVLMPLLMLRGESPRVFIDPHDPVAGEVFMIVVELDTDARPKFQLPAVSGVRLSDRITSTGSRIQIINGKREASVSYGFRALAEKPGKYILPPLKIIVDNRELQTEAIAFTVRDPATLAGPDDLNPDRVQLRMRIVPDRSLYVGETAQVLWELIVPQHVQINTIRDIKESGLGDAVFVPQGKKQSKIVQISNRQTAKNGIRYDIMEFGGWFQPQIAGKFSPSSEISLQVLVASRYEFLPTPREITIRSAAPGLTVLPVPEAPAGVIDTGLIGDWQISLAPPPSNMKSGEVAELTLNISGSVPAEVFRAPEIRIPQARSYPPEVKRTPDGFAVKYLFVPLAPGSYELNVDLAVFDPELQKYRIEKCRTGYNVVPGNVPLAPGNSPGKTAAASEVKPLPLYPREPGKKILLPLADNCKLWALLLTAGGVAFAVAGGVRAWRRKHGSTAAAARETRRKLHALAVRIRETDSAATVLRTAGIADVAAALELPPGATATEIAARIDDAEIKEFFRALDENSFRPGGNIAESAALRSKLAQWLKNLVAIICIFAALPLMADFKAGREAYDRGDYAAAGEHFRSGIDSSAPDPHTYFNIGCSEYMAGDYPDAALAFEQAYLLMPGDAGIKAAWDDCRMHLPGHSEKADPTLTGYITELRDSVRPDWYILTASLAIFLLGAAVFAGKFPYRTLVMILLAAVVVIALTAVWMQSRTTYSPDRARIVAARIEVRRLPAADGSVAGIVPGGAEVWITAVQGNWVQVKYKDKLAGWVPAGSVKRIMPHGIW